MATNNKSIKKWRQFLVSMSANLASASVGTCLAWSSPSIVRLTEKDTPLDEPLDSDQIGWITSLLSLGAVFGPAFVWLTIDKIGRKWCLLSSSLFYTISIILLLIYQKLWAIYLARLLQGLTVGIVNTSQPIYNGEIATDDCRGALGSVMQIFMLCSISYLITFGSILSYKSIQLACLPFCILFPITFIFMPDSPYYYVKNHNYDKAIKTLKFLRGKKTEMKILNMEYEMIRLTIEDNATTATTTPATTATPTTVKNNDKNFHSSQSTTTTSNFRNLLKNYENFKAMKISIGLMISQQITGATAILFSLQSIFEFTKTLDSFTFLIISSLLQIFASFVSFVLVDKFGRKLILITSGNFMALALIGLGFFFYIQRISLTEDDTISTLYYYNLYKWLPFICLLIYLIAYALGYGPIPWIILSELFPTNIKSLAASITVSFCWLLSFIIGKTYPYLIDLIGIDYVMWLYSFCVYLSILFIHYYVFETKGLSLQQIQNKLMEN